MRRFIKKNIKYIIGYTFFCITAFILFLYLLFPREAIRARILYEIGKGTATEIKTTGDKWVFPIGLTFRGIEFTRKMGNASHPLVRIDRLVIQIPIGGMFSFSPVSVLTADIYGGSLKGLLTLRSNNRIVQANWKNVDISRMDRLKDIPIELSGRMSGDLVVRLTGNSPEGQIRLFIKDGKLGKARVMGANLPDLPFEELQGVIDIKGPLISLKDMHFKNNDIKGDIKGDIQLQSDAGSGNLNISIRFAVGEKMKKEYQGFLSFIERSRDREGYYTIQIKGDLKKPALTI